MDKKIIKTSDMNPAILYRIVCVLSLVFLVIIVVVNYYGYLLALLTIKLTYIYLERKYRILLPVKDKSVLITGCDTGFGHHLANRLVDSGLNVFATVRRIDSPGAEKLRNRKLDNLHVLQLDVTNQDDIKNVATTVSKRTKDKGLWGVVNNAGFNIRGDVELCTLGQYKSVMSVNLYGMIAVTKALLPLIRKSKGRIVNVASVMGRYAMPRNSSYNISKYGVETMSDSLRLEMVKFGVNVCIIEPGWYDAATSCSSPAMSEVVKTYCDTMWSEASDEVKELYGKDYFYLPYEHMRTRGEVGSAKSPNPVLDAIEDALLNVNPKPRYTVDGGSGLVDKYAVLARIYSLLPEFITDFILSRHTGCYKSPIEQSEKEN